MRRTLLLLSLPPLLMACTQSEMDQMFPDRNPPPEAPAAITVAASNPGLGGSPCTSLQVSVRGDQATLANSPDLAAGGEWSKTISPEQLAGSTKITVDATCLITAAGADGQTTTQTGYSVTEHPTSTTTQTIRITGPRPNPNLEARTEWARPVPGILPLDP